MHYWRCLLLAFLAAFQPIASFTERNVDRRQECCERQTHYLQRDSRQLYGTPQDGSSPPDDRRVDHRDQTREGRRYELKSSVLTRTPTRRFSDLEARDSRLSQDQLRSERRGPFSRINDARNINDLGKRSRKVQENDFNMQYFRRSTSGVSRKAREENEQRLRTSNSQEILRMYDSEELRRTTRRNVDHREIRDEVHSNILNANDKRLNSERHQQLRESLIRTSRSLEKDLKERQSLDRRMRENYEVHRRSISSEPRMNVVRNERDRIRADRLSTRDTESIAQRMQPVEDRVNRMSVSDQNRESRLSARRITRERLYDERLSSDARQTREKHEEIVRFAERQEDLNNDERRSATNRREANERLSRNVRSIGNSERVAERLQAEDSRVANRNERQTHMNHDEIARFAERREDRSLDARRSSPSRREANERLSRNVRGIGNNERFTERLPADVSRMDNRNTRQTRLHRDEMELFATNQEDRSNDVRRSSIRISRNAREIGNNARISDHLSADVIRFAGGQEDRSNDFRRSSARRESNEGNAREIGNRERVSEIISNEMNERLNRNDDRIKTDSMRGNRDANERLSKQMSDTERYSRLANREDRERVARGRDENRNDNRRSSTARRSNERLASNLLHSRRDERHLQVDSRSPRNREDKRVTSIRQNGRRSISLDRQESERLTSSRREIRSDEGSRLANREERLSRSRQEISNDNRLTERADNQYNRAEREVRRDESRRSLDRQTLRSRELDQVRQSLNREKMPIAVLSRAADLTSSRREIRSDGASRLANREERLSRSRQEIRNDNRLSERADNRYNRAEREVRRDEPRRSLDRQTLRSRELDQVRQSLNREKMPIAALSRAADLTSSRREIRSDGASRLANREERLSRSRQEIRNDNRLTERADNRYNRAEREVRRDEPRRSLDRQTLRSRELDQGRQALNHDKLPVAISRSADIILERGDTRRNRDREPGRIKEISKYTIKTQPETSTLSMDWQTVLYTIQGMYLCSFLAQVLSQNESSKVKVRGLSWFLSSNNLIKVD